MSDFIPNTFQTPNAIVDRLMELLTDSELRVLMYTIRHVLGWQKKIKARKATISISNYVHGFSYTDDKGITHTYAGCGLKEAAVRDALQSLETFRVLKSFDATVHGREWELAFMTDDNVDFGKLIERLYEKNAKGKAKMDNARKANPRLTPSVQQNPSCDTEDTPFCATEPLPSCDTEDNETHVETHVETQKESALGADTSKAKPYYDAIAEQLDIHGGRNVNIEKMLQGVATERAYKPYNLNPVVGVEEFKLWAKWHKVKHTGASMVQSPEKIQSSIMAFRVEQSKPKQSIQTLPRKAPVNLDFLEGK